MLLTEKAPAKINLGLKILGRRSDGYHDILSIFQTISLFDILEAGYMDKAGLDCDNPNIPLNNSNLVLKAENLFRSDSGIKEKAHFSLKKNIPVGAGLGGGSSDGAAALRVLNRLNFNKLSGKEIVTCAEKLGSDVPFLINGGTAVVSGRGEKIEPVSWPFSFTYLLVYPGFPVSTVWAYKSLKRVGANCNEYIEVIDKLKNYTINASELINSLSNDFEATVFEEYPILSNIKNKILKNGAISAFMSGSGSTIIGVFDNREDAISCSQLFTDSSYKLFISEAYNFSSNSD